MSGRVNAFADLTSIPTFDVKPKAPKPVAKDAVDRLAEDSGFVSRQPRKVSSTPKRAPRRYRTGRNRHFGLKATDETVERFYKMADELKVVHGELLELALDALEKSKTG